MKKLILQALMAFSIIGNLEASGITGNKKGLDRAAKEQANALLQNQPVAFLENKGQLFDEGGKPVPFVLYKAQMPGIDMYLTEEGFTYVFVRYGEDEMEREGKERHDKDEQEEEDEVKIEWERVDMTFRGARISKENIVHEGASETDFNFFYSHCPEGIYGVKEYNRITVKGIYPGIDLLLYNSSKHGFKYDFIVGPGADPEQIELVYSSLHPLKINADGSLQIRTDELGALTEKAPVSYQGSREIPSQFIKTLNLKNEKGGYDSHIKFLLGEYDTSLPLTIDPIVVPNLMWGTYYGGSEIGGPSGMEVDNSGNIYITTYVYGASFPLFNMTGAYYQSNMSTNGGCTGGILKFNASRQRVWATFYGGTTGQGLYQNKPTCVTADNSGNIFITGMTECSNFPVQNPGGGAYFQGTTGGGYCDAFILKFNNAGVRQWATYYGGGGGSSFEVGTSVATDASGNVFVTGYTEATNFPLQNLAGAYNQATNGGGSDGFVLKFNNAGVRQWATYYGGANDDAGNAISADNAGNVLITGFTLSANFPLQNLAGGYNQPAYGGGAASWPSPGGDAFLLKFSNAGACQWSTYYGSTTGEEGMAITSDNNGNIFVAGVTYGTSAFPVSNPGGGAYYQGTYLGGATDLFILKFSASGVRQWATFCGGSGDDSFVRGDLERGSEITVDPVNGDFFLTATTNSSNFPTLNSGGFYKAATQGGQDAVIMQFSNSGVMKWATYQGGSSRDWGNAIDIGPDGCLYVVGEWQGGGSNGLMNPGAPAYYDGTYGSMGDDLCVMQFCSSCTAPTGTATATPASCTANNGTASVSATGGQAPYTYSWSPGGQTTSAVTGLASGTYTVVVSEAGGCTQSFTVTVPQQSSFTATATSLPAACGNNNGSASVLVNGGTAPYTYVWSPSGGNSSAATGLGAGNYSVTVTDGNGCSSIQTVSVTSSSAMTASVTATSPPCGTGNGSATVNVTGGTAPYSYNWAPSGGAASTASGLTAGNYTVTITDAGGCTAVQTFSIISSPAITANASSTPTTCGNSIGTVSVSVSGGTAPYTYGWSPSGGNNASASGLAAGTYIVVITDASGCTQTDTAVVSNSNGPSLTLASQTNVLCNGGNTGTASVSVTGGTAPYMYNWLPSGGGANTASGLTAGSYTVIVTDASGCTQNQLVTITQPAALAAIATSTPVCVANNGSASVSATGGTGPYTYAWSPSGGNAVSAGGLSSGTYTVNVTDANGCVQITTVNVAANAPPVASAASNVTIAQGQSATLSASGGGTYSWSNGMGVATITVSPPFTFDYCVTVTNTAGCTDTACVTVTVEPIDCDGAGVVFLPTAFSPNGDADNEELKIYYGNYACIKDYRLIIYNRWGEKVFESSDPQEPWNGTFRGKLEGTAVFVYYLEVVLITGEEISRKGNVSLIR